MKQRDWKACMIVLFSILFIAGCQDSEALSPEEGASEPNQKLEYRMDQLLEQEWVTDEQRAEYEALKEWENQLKKERDELVSQGGNWVEPYLIVLPHQYDRYEDYMVGIMEEMMDVFPPIVEDTVDLLGMFPQYQPDGGLTMTGVIRNGMNGDPLTVEDLNRMEVKVWGLNEELVASHTFTLNEEEVGTLRKGEARPVILHFPQSSTLEDYPFKDEGYLVEMNINRGDQ